MYNSTETAARIESETLPREVSEIKTGSVAIISLGHRTLSFVYQVAPWARKSKQFPFPGFYGNFKTNKSGYSPV